ARRYDLAAINKEHVVNPDSNYCFGEGGAGTYSDGKLYTRSKKRGDVQRIMEILVTHGAKEEILFDAHPHIGTHKLPKLVAELRASIKQAGGQVHFQTRVTDFLLDGSEMKGVRTQHGDVIEGRATILATGHSARDIFHLLYDKKILIEAKPFALGVRVEHRQRLIDSIQYHCQAERGAYLPAAAYALVHQAKINGKDKGVFSFCMCPGGFIVPAATAPGELVVNGMSPSGRNARFANSGIVVAVDEHDYKHLHRFDTLAAMQFQAEVEQNAWVAAGKSQVAPAQRLSDFVAGRESSSLLETSYHPGLTAADMRAFLPEFIADALRQGFKSFGQKMPGYLTNDAQIIGVESRTSSPVRIPRDQTTLQHPQIVNLFPCGEGAGYAGGIVSAAMDGERCAEAAVRLLQ
ncbi:MAG: NAD(P)/FAD-dependent oxidoreductase, partial [Candidatus Binatia bacterium]